jgi:hypothetical protein
MTLLLALLLAQAAEAPPPLPEGAAIHARKHPDAKLRAVEGHIVTPAVDVSAEDVVDEMVDEFAADMARLGAEKVGPVLLHRVRLSANMNPAYAAVLEARLAGALSRATSSALVHCIECNAVRSRVENGVWIVSRGINSREESQAMAKKYGARSWLDVSLALEGPAALAMDVEVVRAEDESVSFAEEYRLDADRALLYRSADRAQAREDRLRDLEARLEGRPRYGQIVEFGAMLLPADSGALWGGVGRYAITEAFGETRSMEAGISAAGFLDSNLAGGILQAMWQTRIGQDNLYLPRLYFGLAAGAFVTGNAGAGPMVTTSVRWLAGSRISFHAMASYLAPFQLHGTGPSYGGFVPEFGAGFTWN